MIRDWFKRLKAREHAWRDAIGTDISTPEARKRALFHFKYVDHAILRVWWHSFHEIAPGVFRANQPSPKRLAYYKQIGIKTILNLRGTSRHSHYLFEAETCATLGLELVDHRMYAADLASREEILGLIDLMGQIEKPYVIHCKSGSDRTGFAAVLYLHIYCGQTIKQAMKQLNWRHFHLKHSKNGILDMFFDAYVEQSAARDLSLVDWIAKEYDATALTNRFAEMRGSHTR